MLSRFDAVAKANHQCRRQGGFTLLELLVVMAILALLLGVVPRIGSGMPGLRLRTATVQLTETLRQLRDEAVRSGQATSLSFDLPRRRYHLSGGEGIQVLPDIVDEVRGSSLRPTATPGELTLQFFADGSSDGGVIALRHKLHWQVITIDWLTGRIDAND